MLAPGALLLPSDRVELAHGRIKVGPQAGDLLPAGLGGFPRRVLGRLGGLQRLAAGVLGLLSLPLCGLGLCLRGPEAVSLPLDLSAERLDLGALLPDLLRQGGPLGHVLAAHFQRTLGPLFGRLRGGLRQPLPLFGALLARLPLPAGLRRLGLGVGHLALRQADLLGHPPRRLVELLRATVELLALPLELPLPVRGDPFPLL